MSRVVIAALCLLVLATPVVAQDDFPRIQMGMGYANLGLPAGGGTTAHYSGFAMQTGFNLARWFGIQNDTGFYGLGNRTTLVSNIVGAKLMRSSLGGRVVPYGIAGIGVGYVTQGGYGGYGYGSMFTTRLGLGADVPLNDSMGIRFDAGRMSIRSGGWQTGWNISTGIVFTVARN